MIKNIIKKFPTDMASFGVNANFLRLKPNARFHLASVGNYETMFLRDLVKIFELEPKGDNCQKVINLIFQFI